MEDEPTQPSGAGKKKGQGRGFEKVASSKKLQTMKRNSKTGQYECPYCVFCSPYYSAVASHTLRHTGEKPFRCKICGYRARQRGHVVVHMQMHEETLPYKCVKCDYSTTQPSHLRVHMRVHVDEEEDDDEKEQGDGKGQCYVTEQLASLKEQMKSEEEKMQLFSCNQCEYVTKRKHNLIQHLAVHTGAKPYKCDLCDYSSSQKGHLNVHIRTHTKEKPFKCPKCPFASTVPKSLREHLQMHYGQRPLKCPYCSFSSSQAFSIKRHIALHEDVKSYACKFCSFKTTVEEDFNHHRSIHTQQASYKCNYCPYESPFKHIFDTHILTHTETLGITIDNRVPRHNIPSIRSRQGVKNRLRNTKKNEAQDSSPPKKGEGQEGGVKKHDGEALSIVATATPTPTKVPKASPTPGMEAMEPEELAVDVSEGITKDEDDHTQVKPARKQNSPTPSDATRTVDTQTMPPSPPELPPTPTLSDKSAPSLPDIATPTGSNMAVQDSENDPPLMPEDLESFPELEIENPMDKLFTCEYCDRELVGQEDWRRHVSRHFMEWPEINWASIPLEKVLSMVNNITCMYVLEDSS